MTALIESLGVRDRAGVEAVIENLIAMLDTMDPDPDLEPELGWTLNGHGVEISDDRDGDDERESDPAEDGIADRDGLHEQLPGWGGSAV